jgi:membrane fusion protein, multidrug efflux system
MKFLKSPYFIMTCLVAGMVVWFISGKPKHASVEAVPQVITAPRPQVGVIQSHAVPHPVYYTFNGKTEAARKVVLKSRIDSVVNRLVAKEGDPVQAGQVILKLATDDRIQQLTKAKAYVDQRELEYNAAVKLAAKNYLSTNSLADKKTQYEQAKVELQNKTLALSNTTIKAPFNGVLNDYVVHEGDTVHAGNNLATIVEMDPLYIKVYINENYYPHIQLHQSANVLIHGMEPMTGQVEYIASVADEQTHTFECHIAIKNPDHKIPSGMSATIKIVGHQEQSMHKLPPVAMSLDQDGRVGVKILENNVVTFCPIQVLESNETEIWATGLPEAATIITTGHDFVSPGETVTAVEQGLPQDSGA